MNLTNRQQDVLFFIINFYNQNSNTPTFKEIMNHFDWTGKAGVHKHLKNLEERGYINRTPTLARSIEILKKPDGSKFNINSGDISELYSLISRIGEENSVKILREWELNFNKNNR